MARGNGIRKAAQSFQNALNLSGAISVYRTVCAIFLWAQIVLQRASVVALIGEF
jgi:hypothetical protein